MNDLAEAIACAAPEALGGVFPKYLALTIATAYVDDIGRLTASQGHLRAATGLSRSTIQRALADLRRRGILVRVKLSEYLDVRAVAMLSRTAEPVARSVFATGNDRHHAHTAGLSQTPAFTSDVKPAWTPMETPGIARTWTLYPVIP